MSLIMASLEDEIRVYNMLKSLQKRFVDKLDLLSENLGENKKFQEITWLRQKGLNGGGSRYESRDDSLFNTASVNLSQVHYSNDNTKALQSATAISTIIHPKNPNVPSIHIHVSLTIFKDGRSFYRLMADLNPSIPYPKDKELFDEAIKEVSKENYDEGKNQGDKYFFIPALNKHRGVSHFYLENYFTNKKEKDFKFAEDFAKSAIDVYIKIISEAFENRKNITSDDIKKQVDYHTLYLFQVLTLDRGTTSGLLVHNQNDVGIMGSLPRFVNKNLLSKWIKFLPSPQDQLLVKIIDSIGEDSQIDRKTKEKLAQTVREHYKKYPDSLKYQASGNSVVNTVQNHIK